MSIRERVLLRQVRHVHPDLRDPRTAAARELIRRDTGVILPPFLLHLPAPDALGAAWAILSEPTNGVRVDRAVKEAVAAAVSATNACPYCVDVHTTTLHGLGSRAAASVIASGRGTVADPALGDVVAWARATRQPGAEILRRPPFVAGEAPEVIGIAVAYHYINRMVNVFAAGSPFPVMAPSARPVLRAIAAPVLRRVLAGRDTRGASASLLPAAPLPGDAAWAAADPIIADAMAGAAARFESLGERFVPEPVRRLVTLRLSRWRGEDAGLSRAWADAAVDELPPRHRAPARLALLVALASHQVDAGVVDAARTREGAAGDELLVATAAWSAFGAARRVGAWLHTGAGRPEVVA